MASQKEYPGIQELFDAIASCPAVGFDGVAMRSVLWKYANKKDFASGVGAAQMGGRWSRAGMRAVYLSLSPLTAAAEAYNEFAAFGHASRHVEPRVFIGASVRLSNVLDLADKSVRQRLGFTLADLLDEDWLAIQREGDESWTQAIGRGAWQAGCEGLLAPSAKDRPSGVNLILFPDRLLPDSRVLPMGLDALPSHPR